MNVASDSARTLRLALLALFVAASGRAHEPHALSTQPPAPAASPAPAPLALPAGWVESPPPAAAKALAPLLTADGDGFLASWIEPAPANGHRLRFARWRGGSWTAAATVAESARLVAQWADVPGVVRAADRSLYAWWLERTSSSGEGYNAVVARSTDEGASWHLLGPLHEDRSAVEHGFVSAVAEGQGVRFYYLDGRRTAAGGPTELRSTVVSGERIGPSALVDDRVCDCCSTATVVVNGGSAVAYRDRTEAEIRDIRWASRSTDGTFRSQPIGADGWKIQGCPVNGPALAGTGASLAVAWFSAPAGSPRLAVARSSDGGATWGVPQALAAAKPLGHLTLAPLPEAAGGFAVAWLVSGAQGGTELRLALLDASGKVAPSQAVLQSAAGRGAAVPRLASTANRLALLWLDAPGTGLRFATIASPQIVQTPLTP